MAPNSNRMPLTSVRGKRKLVLRRGSTMKLLWVTAALGLSFAAFTASAQPVLSAKSGTIALVEGKVYLGDQVVETTLTKFPDIKENGVLRTEDGRAEVLLTPGVSL